MKQQNLDIIYINDIKIPCLIGIYGFERKNKQKIIINIALYVDLNKAGKTDNIKDTVSYRDIYEQIISFVEQSNYYLVEKLASEIAKICLKNKKIRQVKVRLDKPQALQFARSASVEITRNNE